MVLARMSLAYAQRNWAGQLWTAGRPKNKNTTMNTSLCLKRCRVVDWATRDILTTDKPPKSIRGRVTRLRVMLFLLDYIGYDPHRYNFLQCWPSQRLISDELGIPIRTVKRALYALVDLGYLQIEFKQQRRAGQYPRASYIVMVPDALQAWMCDNEKAKKGVAKTKSCGTRGSATTNGVVAPGEVPQPPELRHPSEPSMNPLSNPNQIKSWEPHSVDHYLWRVTMVDGSKSMVTRKSVPADEAAKWIGFTKQVG